jgi:hypothetical protein
MNLVWIATLFPNVVGRQSLSGVESEDSGDSTGSRLDDQLPKVTVLNPTSVSTMRDS